eukprot:5473027-Amphidinium_carterae.1
MDHWRSMAVSRCEDYGHGRGKRCSNAAAEVPCHSGNGRSFVHRLPGHDAHLLFQQRRKTAKRRSESLFNILVKVTKMTKKGMLCLDPHGIQHFVGLGEVLRMSQATTTLRGAPGAWGIIFHYSYSGKRN